MANILHQLPKSHKRDTIERRTSQSLIFEFFTFAGRSANLVKRGPLEHEVANSTLCGTLWAPLAAFMRVPREVRLWIWIHASAHGSIFTCFLFVSPFVPVKVDSDPEVLVLLSRNWLHMQSLCFSKFQTNFSA